MPVQTQHRFNVAEYYRMAQTGVLPPDARVELLDGKILDRSPIGPIHGGIVKRLSRFLNLGAKGRWIVSTQDPVHLDDHSEPEPDVPILVGSGNDKTENTAVLRRVARMGDGWLPSFLTPAMMCEQLAMLRGFCEEEGRDFAALDISLIVPAISFGVGELPPWGAKAYDELKPVNAKELLAEYEEVGVKRILVGLNDMEDDGAFKTLEDAAKGMGL
jgi:hypothetical protein